MISEVTITLTGNSIPNFLPIGAVINYGINRIPTALVQLDPKSLNLLCDFDSIRRKSATLSIRTDNGCITFDGLIDGLSFNQSPGGLSATLVLKHKTQWLTEIYPRIVGIHPTSNNVFNSHPILKADGTDPDLLLKQLTLGGTQLDPSQNLVDFIISLMIAAIETQKVQPITSDDGNTVGIQQIFEEADLTRQGLMDLAVNLLKSIDTTAVQGLNITAGAPGVMSKTIYDIASMRDNIFANLTRLLSDIGCCLVIGNDNSYVVPEAAYLRVPKVGVAGRQRRSSEPNRIFPAEYDNISFNDNGYVNIKGVYVLYDQGTSYYNLNSAGNVEMGQFIDNGNTGNITVISIPQLISYGLVEAALFGGKGMQNKIKNRQPLITGKILTEPSKTQITNSLSDIETGLELRKRFIDQWAQMEYCRLKYDDRTGSFNSAFHNNFVPGAVGTLYTRQPGSFLDYFVVDVCHTFQMNPPNSGRATSTVTFKSGRMGAAANSALDTIDLYQYDYNTSQDFCRKFLRDITG